jgi:hypothetical protein
MLAQNRAPIELRDVTPEPDEPLTRAQEAEHGVPDYEPARVKRERELSAHDMFSADDLAPVAR